MIAFRTTADILRFSVLLVIAISALPFASAAQLSYAFPTTAPLLADYQVKAHHALAADGSTSAAWALRKYYAVVKKDFPKSAEWAQYAYFRQVELEKEVHEKTKSENEAPYLPAPIPMYLYIPSDLIAAYEEAAYAGDLDALGQIRSHYGIVLHNEKLSEYWTTIGILYGDSACVTSFWPYMKNAETDDEREQKLRLIKIAWQKFSKDWSQAERERISETYQEYGLTLE